MGSTWYASIALVRNDCERKTVYTPKKKTRAEVLQWIENNTCKTNGHSDYWYVEDIFIYENLIGFEQEASGKIGFRADE